MNTRKSLQTIVRTIVAMAALACISTAPTLAQGGRVDPNPPYQLGYVDLAITSTAPGYSWENVVWIFVENKGTLPAKATTLGVTWWKGRFSKLFTFPVQSIPAGQGVWIRLDLGFYSQYDPGTHILYQADYYNAVIETNENNNSMWTDN